MAQKNVTEVAKAGLTELAKRVPSNQKPQFLAFQSKHQEYQNRVNKQPDKLPPIDWEFYRLNVRPEAKKWVDEFQKKYKAMCESFDARAEQDYSKYYTELDKARCEMEERIQKFKCESEERIKALEAEYERLKALKPYNEMTMEEYCDTLPERIFTHEGRPSFWPHTLDEQSLEPAVKHDHGHDDHGGGDGHGDGHDKPPPKGGATSFFKRGKKKEAGTEPKPIENADKTSETTKPKPDQTASAVFEKESAVLKGIRKPKEVTFADKSMEEEIERELLYREEDVQKIIAK